MAPPTALPGRASLTPRGPIAQRRSSRSGGGGGGLPPTPPEVFGRVVESMRAAIPRSEILLEDLPAPRNLAPFAHAVGATVLRGDDEIATGKLVLLHDPSGPEAWGGVFRLVSFVAAEVEPELATDPLLPDVTWSWLTDAFAAQGARYTAAGGTVTQTLSTRFGELAGPPSNADVELRASWTPLDERGEAHVLAWCTLLASTAGLPPPGVATLRPRR